MSDDEVQLLREGWERDARRARTAMGALGDLLAVHGVANLGCADATELARAAEGVNERLTSDWLAESDPVVRD